MQLRIGSIARLTAAISAYELVDPVGSELPVFSAGAHVGVRLGNADPRDYSLWNDPAERRRYCIAVLREKEGQLSRRLHDLVKVGDLVDVSEPRNHFPLAEDAAHHLLIAGGIGITPIMAMIAELGRRCAEFRVHYCTRSLEETAFSDVLSPLAAQGRLSFHHDGGDPSRGLDLVNLLRERAPGTHLYYCGPAGLMAAAASAAAHWPAGTVHCEHFKGPNAVPAAIP